MENTTSQQTSSSQQSDKTDLFALLDEANQRNIERMGPTLFGTSKDMISNGVSIISGTLESMAKGMELANSYLTEELDRQAASRTTTKVECAVEQLSAIHKLVTLGASPESAIALATNYRR